jgi:GNAT superfamily N-acetyltransferase
LVFIAECDKDLAGAAMVGARPWWDGNHLFDGEFFVDPAHQRKGIAKKLLRQLIETANQKYAPVFWDTWTFRSEEFPLGWYKRVGFKEIEEWIMIRADVKKLLASLS